MEVCNLRGNLHRAIRQCISSRNLASQREVGYILSADEKKIILRATKLPFINEGETSIFPEKQKLMEFIYLPYKKR